MIIKCSKHGLQSGVTLSDIIHDSFTKNIPEQVQEVVFYFEGIEEGVGHFKSSGEKWDWLKVGMSQKDIDDHYDEYLSYPNTACVMCFRDYLKINGIIPERIEIRVVT